MQKITMILQRSNPPLNWIFNEKYWWVFHVGFWVFIYLDEILAVFGVTYQLDSYLGLVPSVIVYFLMVYLNIYYLLPKYLLKNKIGKYVGYSFLMFLTTVGISSIDFYEPYDLSNPEDVEDLINHTVTTFMHSGIVLIAAVGIKFFKSYILNLEKVNDLEKANLKTELNFLKNQINPHFLFNSLNNIYVQSRKRPEEASESILLLSDLMRYQLYDCTKEKVLLRHEINYLKNYLQLDKIRKSDTNISFQVYGELGGLKVAPFIFIPFVENAIKHGLMDGNNSFLKIIFSIKPHQINFTIENAKPIVPNEQEVGGIGLVNVKRRLELIYQNQYSLHIANQEDIYKVGLTLELAGELNIKI